MSDANIPKKLFQQLIFGDNATSQESLEENFEEQDESRDGKDGTKRLSAYVLVFEGMVRTVIEHENNLLSEPEIAVLEQFSKLSYNTRYCLIRLLLRKSNQWHAVSALESYTREVGEEGLKVSLEDLCKPITTIIGEGSPIPPIKSEPSDLSIKSNNKPHVIDLTLDSGDEDVKPNVGPLTPEVFADYFANKPSSSKPKDPIQSLVDSNDDHLNLDFFCEDESVMTLNEILWRLTKDQLAELVKTTKCKPKGKPPKKSDMIEALQTNALTQSIFGYNFTPNRKNKKGKGKDDGLIQTQLSSFFSKAPILPVNQEQRLREMALDILGKCVRVNFDFYRLVRRLHIIYYRETDHPTALLLPSLLTTFKKRNYTAYDTTRSKNIWSSREELLGYEKALELEYLLDEVLNPPPEKNKRKMTKPPGRTRSEFRTPATPSRANTVVTPLKTPGSVVNMRQSQTPDVKREEDIYPLDQPGEEEPSEEICEVTKEDRVKEHFKNWLFPTWKEHIARQSAQESTRERSLGLERFETGYVYTRMVRKANKVFGPLKEYQTELETIECLLSQRFWSRGKRGRLYERRTIILGHLTRLADATNKQDMIWRNVEGLKEALLDLDTGLVHRPGFVKRLAALEKRLNIPPNERTKCDGKLREAATVEFKAFKIPPLMFDAFGRPVNTDKENAPDGLHAYMPAIKDGADVAKSDQPEVLKKKMGKSKWKGRSGAEVDVETRALEFYENQGYKGFHSETRILTTIFGLLFWDIIFMNIPGAFETAFQSGPLDMFEDSFYYARKDSIEVRKQEIRAGRAQEILERHDNMYREKKTWCLCVNWDFCTKEDLIEIIGCIKGDSLAEICELFFQDYRGRSSGGPDLFVWKPAQRHCKFVEVKGPGDIARENQKLWFDALLQAGIEVELCKVLDENYQPPPSSSRKRKVKTPTITSKRKKLAHDESFSDDVDYDKLDPERDDEDPPFSLPDSIPAQSPTKRRRISVPSQ